MVRPRAAAARDPAGPKHGSLGSARSVRGTALKSSEASMRYQQQRPWTAGRDCGPVSSRRLPIPLHVYFVPTCFGSR